MTLTVIIFNIMDITLTGIVFNIMGVINCYCF